MNQYVEAFLKDVLDKVKYKKIHPYLAQELNDHIECLKEDFMEEGLDEEKAYKEAVAQMGQAESIGEQLHQMHKPRMEWSIILLLIGLVAIGLGTMIVHKQINGSINYYSKQLMWSICGVGILLGVMYCLDYKRLEKHSTLFYGIGIGILLFTLFYGVEFNGLRRFIMIGPISVQSGPLVTPFLIVAYVGYVKRWINQGFWGHILLGVLAFIPVSLCSMMQFAQSICLLIVFGAIFVFYLMSEFFKGNRKKVWMNLVILCVLFITTLITAIISVPYRLERAMIWFKPSLAPNDEGYFVRMIRSICGHATWFGRGHLSEVEESLMQHIGMTDYTFNFILAYMGKVVAFIVALVVGCFIIRCFKSAYKVRDQYGQVLMLGISSLLGIRFIFSIGLSLGILPFYCSMPLIGYSGSAFLCDMAMMGLFLGIYRRKDICPSELIKKESIEYKEIDLLSAVKRFFTPEDEDEVEIDEDDQTPHTERKLVEMALELLQNSNEVEYVEVRFKERDR